MPLRFPTVTRRVLIAKGPLRSLATGSKVPLARRAHLAGPSAPGVRAATLLILRRTPVVGFGASSLMARRTGSATRNLLPSWMLCADAVPPRTCATASIPRRAGRRRMRTLGEIRRLTTSRRNGHYPRDARSWASPGSRRCRSGSGVFANTFPRNRGPSLPTRKVSRFVIILRRQWRW